MQRRARVPRCVGADTVDKAPDMAVKIYGIFAELHEWKKGVSRAVVIKSFMRDITCGVEEVSDNYFGSG